MSNGIDNVRFNFLYIDTYSFGKTWVYPESTVPYNMLRYIISGSGTFFIDKEEVAVSQNQIVYIPRGCRMSCYANSDSLAFSSIRFATSVYFEGGDFLTDYYGIPRVMEARGEEKYFEMIDGWVRSSKRGRMYFVRGYLEILIGSLIERAAEDSCQVSGGLKTYEEYTLEKLKYRMKKLDSKIDPRIQVVVDYIALHPTEKYTPERMAQMAELSKQRFSHLFKEQLGKSPMMYIKEIRMTNAARRLLVNDDNVSDIAYSVGYEDPNYFIREFKKAFGYTPNQYRKAARK